MFIRLLIILLISLGLSQLIYAADSGLSTVAELRVAAATTPNILRVKLTSDAATKPGCHTSTQYDYSMDLTTRGQNATYATLLSAMAQNKLVRIKSANSVCNNGAQQINSVSIYEN